MKSFDNPQQVSVHLVSAMGCCDSSSSASNIHLTQALQNQKQVLETEMHILQQKCLMMPSLDQLAEEIDYLQTILNKFQQQNIQAQRLGFMNLENTASQFVKIQHLQTNRATISQSIERQYIAELNIHKELTLQIEQVIMKVKILHDSNNIIVRNFGH